MSQKKTGLEPVAGRGTNPILTENFRTRGMKCLRNDIDEQEELLEDRLWLRE